MGAFSLIVVINLLNRLVMMLSTAKILRLGSKSYTNSGMSCKYCCQLRSINHQRHIQTSTFNKSAQTVDKDKESKWFGYESVPNSDEKQRRVNEVFSAVASNYDVMNDVMSFGVHRYWKDEFVRQCNVLPGMKVLDMAGGTGDIAFRIHQQCPEAEIIVGDISQEMLDVGMKKTQSSLPYSSNQITWKVADGQNLPFGDNQFDLYTVSFGIRNYGDLEKGLTEAYRVLKPGGRFMCLEFSDVDNEILKQFYDRYSLDLIPVFGALIASDWDSYKYLVESIRKFPNKIEFENMIRDAGFKLTKCDTFINGVAAIHSGYKL